MGQVFTIGYEGASLADFVGTLQTAGVRHVADIRELPQSRRPGFSKNKLAEALAQAGITYEHIKQLGDPKPGREAARRGDHAEFQRIFSAHMELAESVTAVASLAKSATDKPTALLCYERNPQECHRAIVARHLNAEYSLSIQHIGVVNGAGQQRCELSTAA